VDTSTPAVRGGRRNTSKEKHRMNALRLMAAGLLAIGLIAGVRAEEKKADTNKEKLVGSWEVTKSHEGGPPVGAVIVFGKDGKMKITTKKDDKETTMEGTYTIDEDKLTVTVKKDDKEDKHKITIKKLSDTEFVAENDQGKSIECKKKK
jgi:uncharacterized protein (TIGR03066 family)